MATPLFEVIKPGLFTSFQDMGREGFLQYGMVTSGAMDPLSLQIGNILVGNGRREAGLEINLMGPSLQVLNDAVIAVCGGDLSPAIDGTPLPMWKSVAVKKGQHISFGIRKSGARSYITVAGGFDIPEVMGSKSTYAKARIGGLEGREVRKGDILLKAGEKHSHPLRAGMGLSPSAAVNFEKKTFAIITGPDRNRFSDEAIKGFLEDTYQISPQSDRMGFRLSGNRKIPHEQKADILSSGIVQGTIQVPASGEPIVLMADRQTTGGYARIGTVISADLPYLAQKVPGETICFEEISLHDAHLRLRRKEAFLKRLEMMAGAFVKALF